MYQTGTILIVDDDLSGRKTLEALLYAFAYQLLFACSGAEALEKAAAHAPDLILLDVMMPGMDGFEVCRRLRNDPQLSEVPVIMVTALDDRESRLAGLDAGADDFVSKPFDRTELRSRVRTVMRLNRYRRLVNHRARFERLIELSPDSILIVDSSDLVRLTNPSMVRMLRAPDEAALLERKMQGFVVPEQQAAYTSLFQTVLAAPDRHVAMETVLICLDGAQVCVDIHAGYALWDDQPAVQIIARDISERKEAEVKNLSLLQKLADRERRLQDLVEKLFTSQEEERRRVAYELHDGLAQVASSTHQHLQTFASDYCPTDRRAAQELDRALELAQRTVKEVRLVIAGMRPTVLDDFGLASALRVEVETLRADGWDVRYEELTSIERVPPAIETAVFRVAQEALTNIRKHAQTKHVRMSLFCDDQSVRLEVQDEGVGFDIAALPEATGRGEQIGLPGMQERMALLDGTLHISSQPGKGTLVVAEAPFPDPVESDSLPVETTGRPHAEGTSRVLIADDHELSRAGMRTMLKGERSFELVGEATNGHEAVELCQKLRPDLALLDVRMPEMDGLQATRAIKQVSPETSVIIVTMHENADYLIAAIRSGAAGYLLKDTDRRELLAAIRGVLRGESFLNTELTQRLLQHMSSEKPQHEVPQIEPLTPRELEVLRLLTQGKTNREIASGLVISALTVKVHVQHIIAKLKVSDRTQAAVRATELGLLQA